MKTKNSLKGIKINGSFGHNFMIDWIIDPKGR